MAARQARKRKSPTARTRPELRLPAVWVQRVLLVLVVVAVTAPLAVYAKLALDVPVSGLVIDAQFQRVSQQTIQATVEEELARGFLGARLSHLRESLESLPWVDRASVRRVWPDKIHLALTEQVAAARWGEKGLLNTRGELFIQSQPHEFEELPSLSGSDDKIGAVAAQYLALRGPLVERGLGRLRAISLDERGAWRFILGNGIEVRLGRRDARERAERFLQVASAFVLRNETKIRYVDMRYSNGFAVGWRRPEFRDEVHARELASLRVVQEGN